MAESAAPIQPPAMTYADLVWPRRTGGSLAVVRGIVLAVLGACLLTLSAKVQVPGPVPMTLQTLAVLILGAVLGCRLALASVVLYLVEGALGAPVFANTPPLASGIAYFVGPTGGFLVGFAGAAAFVGLAADRGLIHRPFAFAFILLAAEVLIFLAGFLWLAFAAKMTTGASGLGPIRAFSLGVQPFFLGETIKLLLGAIGLPLVFDTLSRLVRR